MADEKLYYDDPALDRVRTRIVERGEAAGRPYVRLERTVFYPEGGGQPPDRGTIAGVEVLDVQSRGGEVLHFLAAPLDLGPRPRGRGHHRRQAPLRPAAAAHGAAPRSPRVLADRHRRPTTSFHLGDRFVAIEVEGDPLPPHRLTEVEAEVNALVLEDRKVMTRWVSPEILSTLPVRTRGLPKDHAGDVRLVEIEGIDLNTCGGTHVNRLGEIQAVHVLGAERARGGARITFLAGSRVLWELRRAETVEGAIKERIGTAPEEFAAILDGWAAERKRAAKKIKELEAQLAIPLGEALATEPGPLLARVLPGGGPELLRAVANAALAKRPDTAVVLVSEEEGCFLVQAGPQGPEDVASLGAQIRQSLSAKGGGRGRTFQGTGGRVPAGLDLGALLARA